MAARKRIVKKVPDFRVTRDQQVTEENDLKKVKAQALKELEEKEKNKEEWLDTELDKNLKQQK
jgi:hypothetical protein